MAEKNLNTLLSNLDVKLNEGTFVFVSFSEVQTFDKSQITMQFQEAEGITYILKRDYADELNLDYDFIAAWITLNVHSALDAVGLTAVISKTLADANISSNIVAAFYHDHIFVANKDATKAVVALRNLSNK